MNMPRRWTPRPGTGLRPASIGLVVCLLANIASSQMSYRDLGGDMPEAEFHMARVIYRTFGGGGSGRYRQPWWAIDYPMAETHFLPALGRFTNLSVADDSRHLEVTDDRIFAYPFLFMQQVGRGNWRPSTREAESLREYLLRGGFLVVDDFHGPYDWDVFESAMDLVLPGRPIMEIPDDDPLMNVFFDLGDRIQIPGRRHLRFGGGEQGFAAMSGPPHWCGIYDEAGRLMVAISFNIDMGDAWEHADDPYYPAEMTGLAYRLGVNYVIYAMTH